MQKPLVFMMGISPAFLPIDRLYTQNHMWAIATETGYRFGLSAYAVRLLGDMHHLKWSVRQGDELARNQTLGHIEASKATSDLYAPMPGRLVQLNPAVPADPTLLNSDLYETGWLLEIAGHPQEFLSPDQYLAHLEACWPLAQRILKGQAGRQEQ